MNLDSPNGGRSHRLRDRFREATNRAILDAAERVFSRAGFGGTRMEDIAAEAGVAVGTLYNHFADRGALVAAVFEARARDLSEALDRALATDGGFQRRIIVFLETLLEHYRVHQPFFAALAQTRMVGGTARLRAVHQSTARTILGRAEQLVANGVQDGTLEPLPTDLMSAVVVGVVFSAGLRTHLLPGAPLPANPEELAELLLHGIGRRQETRIASPTRRPRRRSLRGK